MIFETRLMKDNNTIERIRESRRKKGRIDTNQTMYSSLSSASSTNFDENTKQHSIHLQNSIKDLKSLGTQLYTAAKYFEVFLHARRSEENSEEHFEGLCHQCCC